MSRHEILWELSYAEGLALRHYLCLRDGSRCVWPVDTEEILDDIRTISENGLSTYAQHKNMGDDFREVSGVAEGVDKNVAGEAGPEPGFFSLQSGETTHADARISDVLAAFSRLADSALGGVGGIHNKR